MTWIKTVSYQQASGALKRLYERIKGPDDNVDNIMLAHSLRPHSMEGHMALYKYVLHHPRNTLAKSYLETIGVYVSLLNRCDYCARHHFAGLSRLFEDGEILAINQIAAYFAYANRTVFWVWGSIRTAISLVCHLARMLTRITGVIASIEPAP